MAASNTLQPVISLSGTDGANKSIRSVNAAFDKMGSGATDGAREAAHSIDDVTTSVAKGAAAGAILAGVIDLSGFLRALAKIGYDGALSVEVFGWAKLRASNHRGASIYQG